jgi:hypothetical protein
MCRAAVQHLATFVPWEQFLLEESGDINAIWEKQKQLLPRRLRFLADNIQLLRRSAEDAKRDAKQWASVSGETNFVADRAELGGEVEEGAEELEEGPGEMYRCDDVGNAVRLIDVLRSTVGGNQITAGSRDVTMVVQQLCRFQQVALGSVDELRATILSEGVTRTMDVTGGTLEGVYMPEQRMVKSIKSQQRSLSREKERRIQGIQTQVDEDRAGQSAAVYDALDGFGEDVEIPRANFETLVPRCSRTRLQLGQASSFVEGGRQLGESYTLNQRQTIAFKLLCRQLDRVARGEAEVPQLCQFVGGEGGTGKSRIVEAVVELFESKGLSHRLLVTATSGAAAARINGITIHSACGFSKDMVQSSSKDAFDRFTTPNSTGLRVDGQSRMDWQEKQMLIIDEVSMLGARTLYAVNERLRTLRGCSEDFGGIPVVLLCGDFHQFRPVHKRSILLPSTAIAWDEGRVFKAEQRYQHDKGHALWKRFTTVVLLKEQVRAAGDLKLQQLLTRIRKGEQDVNVVDFLNHTCFREGQRIPWESGITAVTPLNRNRWNLNIEATLSFQKQHRAQLRIFISEHQWKGGRPTEKEALMVLNHGDDSSIPVPAVFLFVPSMPVVVNQNTHQGLKLVNGASYMALEVILDRKHPGHRVSADTILHFGPPAGILLASETTTDFRFVGMPPGTILLTPISSRIECARKRPWQRTNVARKGLPCTAAFACTDYKVQGRTLERVALELRGTRTTNIDGQAVPSQCDPYGLYVQLSRCTSLGGIMLLSRARERDVVGNTIPENMAEAEQRLEGLSEATIRDHIRDHT